MRDRLFLNGRRNCVAGRLNRLHQRRDESQFTKSVFSCDRSCFYRNHCFRDDRSLRFDDLDDRTLGGCNRGDRGFDRDHRFNHDRSGDGLWCFGRYRRFNDLVLLHHLVALWVLSGRVHRSF